MYPLPNALPYFCVLFLGLRTSPLPRTTYRAASASVLPGRFPGQRIDQPAHHSVAPHETWSLTKMAMKSTPTC